MVSPMLQDKDVWARYAEGTAGREPMGFLDTAIKVTNGDRGDGRTAIDLGCGAGNETLALLERGWRVHAVDGERQAIDILTNRVSEDNAVRLTTEVSLFHEAHLPEADLVFASLSLPFAAEHLRESVDIALKAVKADGWLVAVFFGRNDTWAAEEDVAVVEPDDIYAMLDGFEMITIDESEFDGFSGAGPKRWHWYVVSAHRQNDLAQ
jgi:SAM-dependent methyltransferase